MMRPKDKKHVLIDPMLAVQDAAELYERAGMHEKAATMYIQAGAFGLAAPLMALIMHNPKLQLEFAKAKESKPCHVHADVS